MLHALIAGVGLLAGLFPPSQAEENSTRVLFLTRSAGFVHDVVKRSDPETLSHAENQLVNASRGRLQILATQDCGVITTENLKKFSAVVFYTSGELPISDENKKALIDFVKGGGGFVGIHSATDTWYKYPEFGEMLGGYFDGHPWTQEVRVKVEDNAHPSTKHLGKSFVIKDEIYQFRSWSREKVRMLMSLDNSSIDVNAKGVKRADKDFAVAWCKDYGKGRVFFTSLGHFPEVWTDQRYLTHLIEGIIWAGANKKSIPDPPKSGWERELDEEGFIPLLSERYSDGWKQAGPGGFKVENGVATSFGGLGLWYFEPMRFENFILKAQFKQQNVNTNSGVYFRVPRVAADKGPDPWIPVKEAYEIQIAGDKPHKQTTGSVYSFQAATAAPLKTPGEWNEYEITGIGPMIYVRLNGQLINTFDASGMEGGERSREGMIGVQNHDEKSIIQYRSIRVKPLPKEASAYHVLFAGDGAGWKQAGPGGFKLADGALHSEGGMGLYWHTREFKDFILLLDYKVNRRECNSGIFLRFPDPGNDPWVAVRQGYEVQISDADPPKHRTGSIYSLKDSTSIPTLPPGQWNRYEIKVVGQKYEIWLNGKKVNDFTGDRGLAGRIGLQNHDPGSQVAFRNVRVVELK